MTNTAILSNYNLDSAIGTIFLDNMLPQSELYSCGSGKISQYIQKLKEKNAERVYVVGYPYMSKTLLKELRSSFLDVNVFGQNESFKEYYNYYSQNGTAFAVLKYIMQVNPEYYECISKNSIYSHMAVSAHEYYKMNISDTKNRFRDGYFLNALFSKIGMWDFVKSFPLVKQTLFSTSEKKIIERYFKERDDVLFSTTPILVGNEGFLTYSDKYIDDFSITFPGYSSFHIVRPSTLEDYGCSLSSRIGAYEKIINSRKQYSLINAFSKIESKYSNIVTLSSGNDMAYGIVFKKGTTSLQIYNFVDDFAFAIEEGK